MHVPVFVMVLQCACDATRYITSTTAAIIMLTYTVSRLHGVFNTQSSEGCLGKAEYTAILSTVLQYYTCTVSQAAWAVHYIFHMQTVLQKWQKRYRNVDIIDSV